MRVCVVDANSLNYFGVGFSCPLILQLSLNAVQITRVDMRMAMAGATKVQVCMGYLILGPRPSRSAHPSAPCWPGKFRPDSNRFTVSYDQRSPSFKRRSRSGAGLSGLSPFELYTMSTSIDNSETRPDHDDSPPQLPDDTEKGSQSDALDKRCVRRPQTHFVTQMSEP